MSWEDLLTGSFWRKFQVSNFERLVVSMFYFLPFFSVVIFFNPNYLFWLSFDIV
jgi:hypothetical protein